MSTSNKLVQQECNETLLTCCFCGKLCKNKNSLAQHQLRCKLNPQKLIPTPNQFGGSNYHREPWNKGLTKETDERLKLDSLRKTKVKPDYQLLIDDDGKLYQRFCNKRVNAKAEGIEFQLSFKEYCLLVSEANLVSSQLGYTGQNYVLARVNDSGPYKYGNCRFLTQKQNSEEKLDRLFPHRTKNKLDV